MYFISWISRSYRQSKRYGWMHKCVGTQRNSFTIHVIHRMASIVLYNYDWQTPWNHKHIVFQCWGLPPILCP